MPALAETGQAGSEQSRVGVYVYGIVPGDVELVPDTQGVGDPQSDVALVRHGDIAAIVSKIDVTRPLGRPEDLTMHERLLDATAAADVPVLPMRFGAVVTDEQAVTDELLAAYHDLFANALKELEGRAQYVLLGRYVEDAVLREVLSENSVATALRHQIQDLPEQATQDLRIRLGDIVNAAIEAKRQVDTGRAIEGLTPHSIASAVRPPSHEQDAVHVAFLVELSKEKEFEQAVEEMARDWDGRIELRLSGPLAPYDFVVSLEPDS